MSAGPGPGGRSGRTLYLIACGAPQAADTPALARLAQARGWDPCIIATPSALKWLDTEAALHATGRAVRSEYKQPGEVDALPPADAIVVAPASFNTVNKWASGITDTLALGMLCELMGADMPIVAALVVNGLLDRHPKFREHVRDLESWGIRLIHRPTEPRARRYPDHRVILDALDREVAP